MKNYLTATKRKSIGDLAQAYASELKEDKGAEYDELIEINLSELEPHINGPFTPDLATPISKFKQAVQDNKWPEELKVGLIGSCTNSSYEDMSRAASIAQDALDHGVKAKSMFTVTPGSEQVSQSAESCPPDPSSDSAKTRYFVRLEPQSNAMVSSRRLKTSAASFSPTHVVLASGSGIDVTSRKAKRIPSSLRTIVTSRVETTPIPRLILS